MALFGTTQIQNVQGQVTDLEVIRRLLEEIKILLVTANTMNRAAIDNSLLTERDSNVSERDMQ